MADDRSSHKPRRPESPRENSEHAGGARSGQSGSEDGEDHDEGEGDSDLRANDPTGVGSEAAEGMHGAGADRSDRDETGAGAARREKSGKGSDRTQGSEPLEHRDSTHSSNYGGELGEPRREG